MERVAVLGTGLLGTGFVEKLLSRGIEVKVWNRSVEKTRPLAELGAVVAIDPSDAVRGCDRVHLVLAEDSAVDAVLAAAKPAFGRDVPVLDHSTNLPVKVAARYLASRAKGVRYVHAPVFMSPANAREAQGLMLFAGPKAEFDELTPVLQPMTGRLWHVGERPDLAAAHKLFGNAVLVALCGTVGDLFAIGGNLGLAPIDVMALFEVFKPASAVPYIGSRVAKKGEGPPSFTLEMARKDVRLMLEAAGGPEGLVVLPAVAHAMDRELARGTGDRDYGIFAWPRGVHPDER